MEAHIGRAKAGDAMGAAAGRKHRLRTELAGRVRASSALPRFASLDALMRPVPVLPMTSDPEGGDVTLHGTSAHVRPTWRADMIGPMRGGRDQMLTCA
jgi:hypothetical protein